MVYWVTTIELSTEKIITKIFEDEGKPVELEKPIKLKAGFYKVKVNATNGNVEIIRINGGLKRVQKVAEGQVKGWEKMPTLNI